MKKNNNNNLSLQNNKILIRIKKSIFNKELYNQKSITFKITASAIFLAMAVGLSLLEVFGVPTLWGTKFNLRFFDTLLIIYSIAIVGLWFALLEGIILPLIHNLIDGHHIWLEMAFFMISNILVIFVTWFVYYILFNAYYKVTVPENIEDHNIHEYHYIKKKHDHHHKIINIKWRKKILAFIIIVPACVLIETVLFLIITKILININNNFADDSDANNIQNYFRVFLPTDNITNNLINWYNKINIAHDNYNCRYNHNNGKLYSMYFLIITTYFNFYQNFFLEFLQLNIL